MGDLYLEVTRQQIVFKDWMVIKSGGKVGIGTTSPEEKIAH